MNLLKSCLMCVVVALGLITAGCEKPDVHVTVLPPSDGNTDTTPNAFSFTPATDVAKDTDVVSNEVTVTGFNAPAAISVTGGAYSVNGAAFTAAPGTVSPNDRIRLQVRSSSAFATTVTETMEVGGITASFSVTTLADPDGGSAETDPTFSDGKKTVPEEFTIPAGAGVTIMKFDIEHDGESGLKIMSASDVDIDGQTTTATTKPTSFSNGTELPAGYDEFVDRYATDELQVLLRIYESEAAAQAAASNAMFHSKEKVAAERRAYAQAYAHGKATAPDGAILIPARLVDGRVIHDVDLSQLPSQAHVHVQVNCPNTASKVLWLRLFIEEVEIEGRPDGTTHIDTGFAPLFGCRAATSS